MVNQDDYRLTLSVEEARASLGIGRNTMYEAIHQGQIPFIRIGRRILIPRVALERFLLLQSSSGQYSEESK